MHLLENKEIAGEWNIQSSNLKILRILHEQYPKVISYYIVSKGSIDNNLKLLGGTPSIYNSNYKCGTQ